MKAKANGSHKTLLPTLLLAGILFLGAFLRLWQLGNIPHGLSNDEAAYIYSSYSLWKTGHDVAGEFLPLSINLNNSFSPVYIYADAPFVGILGLNPFAGRLPYALAGILTILVLYYLTYELFGKKSIALLSALLLAISPWHLQLTRGALDADFALLFYLAGVLVFIKGVKGRNILWSLPFFLLAFYSYHATKIFFLFLIPILVITYRKELLKRKKELTIFLIGAFAIFLSFIYVSATQSVTRQQVFFWSDSTQATETVKKERLYNSAPAFLQKIFSNKGLYYARIVRENYLEAFSPQYLFLYGEPSGIKRQYSQLTRGELFIIELPFLLIGFYCAIRYRKGKLPLFLLLIAPLCSTFAGDDRSYVNRSIMMLPFLLMFVALGAYYFYQYLLQCSSTVRRIALAVIIILYGFLFSSYLYHYYFRYDIESAEAWNRSSRELAELVGSTHHQYKNVYFDSTEKMFLFQYGIFNTVDPRLMQKAWKNPYSAQFGNVHFNAHCATAENAEKDISAVYEKGSLVIVPNNCFKNSTPSAVIKEKGDLLRTLWKIYEL